jgi:hypothetical protein
MLPGMILNKGIKITSRTRKNLSPLKGLGHDMDLTNFENASIDLVSSKGRNRNILNSYFTMSVDDPDLGSGAF